MHGVDAKAMRRRIFKSFAAQAVKESPSYNGFLSLRRLGIDEELVSLLGELSPVSLPLPRFWGSGMAGSLWSRFCSALQGLVASRPMFPKHLEVPNPMSSRAGRRSK